MSKVDCSYRFVRQLTTITSAGVLLACSATGPATEQVSSTEEALTDPGSPAMVTISGTITDPLTGPQAGITVTLAGSAQAQKVTDWSGSFSFSGPSGGSYSITAVGNDNYFRPPFHSCLAITPSIVNLNNLTQDTNIPMTGSGTDGILNCSPSAAAGAGSGSLKIQGKISTADQKPVAGVRVRLNGSTQGYRTTDETGFYSFSVNPGSYSVQATNTCGSFNPSVTNLNNLKANRTLDLVGSNCPPAPLTMCPALDLASGIGEPAACGTTSSPECALDREMMWAGQIPYEFQV
ncbi:MAG TPA: carboxypeptidase regulatory-like domain-containing protein, partial [Polyangiaceae bacterium]